MAYFNVHSITTGNTFEVDGWTLGNYSGTTVTARGIVLPSPVETGVSQFAKNKLSGLIEKKFVELKNAEMVTSTHIKCDVYLDGVNIATYFPEFAQ